MIERVALAAKTTTVRTGDDTDSGGLKIENFGQRAMNVVRCLRGGVERQSIVVFRHRDRAVLFHGQMSVAGVEEIVLEHQIGDFERPVDIAETHRHSLVHVVALLAVTVDR